MHCDEIENFSGEKATVLARRYGVNECTIRSIRVKGKNIRQAATLLGEHRKFDKMIRQECVVKMENLLVAWIQDMIKKKIPLSGAKIKKQALNFYQYVKEKYYQNTEKSFCTSDVWFERFRKRFNLHNISFTGIDIKFKNNKYKFINFIKNFLFVIFIK